LRSFFGRFNIVANGVALEENMPKYVRTEKAGKIDRFSAAQEAAQVTGALVRERL
jgi:hypothetical protein